MPGAGVTREVSAHDLCRVRNCVVRDCDRDAEAGSDECWQCGRGDRPLAADEVTRLVEDACRRIEPEYVTCAALTTTGWRTGMRCHGRPMLGSAVCWQHRGQA